MHLNYLQFILFSKEHNCNYNDTISTTPEIQEPSLAILHKIPKSQVRQWQKCWNHRINLKWDYHVGPTTNNKDMHIFCHSISEFLDMSRCMRASKMESAKFWYPAGFCYGFRSPARVSSIYCAWQIWQYSQLCCLCNSNFCIHTLAIMKFQWQVRINHTLFLP